MLKYLEFFRAVLPWLKRLDTATRTSVFTLTVVGFSSHHIIKYVDAKQDEGMEKVRAEKEALEEKLADKLSNTQQNIGAKMDAQHQVVISMMRTMNDSVKRTQDDVRDTQKNVIQIYRDISTLKNGQN